MIYGELGFPVRAKLAEFVADFTRGAQALDRVEQVVRITVLVEAVGCVLAGLALERADGAAEIQVAFFAGLHRFVVGGSNEFFEPGVFDALADLEIEFGAVQFFGETGFEFDFMRILVALAKAKSLHPHTADDAGEAVEVGGAGAHTKRFGGRQGADNEEAKREQVGSTKQKTLERV